MFQSTLNMMLMTSALIFSQMKHPLAMGFLLLIQVFIISMIMGSYNDSFWFSYILFLVFLGGMLVLFIYVTALASNEMFYFSLKLMILSMMIMFLSILVFLIIDNMNLTTLINIKETLIMELNNNNKEMLQINLKLYNSPSNLLTIMLINYLFLTLIAVVKITNLFNGPLRNMQ